MDKYPFSDSFQLKILALVARDKVFLQEHRSTVSASYFDSEVDRTLVRLILKHTDQFKDSPSYSALVEQLKDHVSSNKLDTAASQSLFDRLDQVQALEIEDEAYVRDRILHFARNQSMKQALIEVVDMVQDGGLDDDKYQKVRDIFSKTLSVGETGGQGPGYLFFEEINNLPHQVSVESRYARGRVIRTLIPGLDQCLIGGIGPGQIGVFIAPPKRGKSMVLVNMGAAALAQGKVVVHISFELDKHDIALRYAARLTNTEMSDIVLGKVPDWPARAAMLSELNASRNLIIQYERPNTVQTSWIRGYLNKLVSVYDIKPDLLIVDYADLIRKKYETEGYISAGIIYQDLIAIGVDFGIPIWTASQAGRQAQSKDITGVDDVADSWKKIQDADVVATLNQTPKMKRDGKMTIYVAAVRRGYDGRYIECEIDYGKCALRENRTSDMPFIDTDAAPISTQSRPANAFASLPRE